MTCALASQPNAGSSCSSHCCLNAGLSSGLFPSIKVHIHCFLCHDRLSCLFSACYCRS